ncbi:MAG: cyclase family protein [Halobacteriovoraceae bacterium]|nr:cyclase family protein [Halobacteriovoraceae bacterium]
MSSSDRKILFLSHYLDPKSTPSYGNNEGQLTIVPASCICSGDSSNSLTIKMSNHIGTHIDLPRHFDDKGKVLNDYNPEDWIFTSPQLIDLPKSEEELIEFNEINELLASKTDFLILRTGFEKFRGQEAYWARNPGFAEETGRLLRKNYPNLKAIGFDFISITSYPNRPLGRLAHKSFLSSEFEGEPIRAIEDMTLNELKSSPLSLTVAPLMVNQADGVQVTVFALIGNR